MSSSNKDCCSTETGRDSEDLGLVAAGIEGGENTADTLETNYRFLLG